MTFLKKVLNIRPARPSKVVFVKKVGDKTIVGIEDEFILTSSEEVHKAKAEIEVEYASAKMLAQGYNLSPAEASRRYNVSASTIRRYCRKKKIDCVKRGRRWFINGISLKQFLDLAR